MNESCVLLVDFNNLMFRTLHAKDVCIRTEVPAFQLWRYLVFDSVFQQMAHLKNVSEVVLAIDDKNQWRRSYYPRYKESRKKGRDDSGINWPFVFKVVQKYISDVKHHLPFKVLKIRHAEADDIIAVVATSIRDKVVISSNDEDFLQLSSDRIKIWNPNKRDYLEVADPERWLQEKILMGQSQKDDVFNVKTPTDWGQTADTIGKRKPGLGPKTAKKIVDEGLDKWLEREGLQDNYHRNEVLIDFNFIPQTIRQRILTAYKGYTYPPLTNAFDFFKKYDLRYYIEKYNFVEETFSRLY